MSKRRMIICGDFNAKSPMWASRTRDRRRECIEEWAAENDIYLLNIGAESTCVRKQSSSIVDLSWCTTDIISYIHDWNVLQIETLSDHRYIRFKLSDIKPGVEYIINRHKEPSWNFKKLDVSVFKKIELKCALERLEDRDYTGKEMVKWIQETMIQACNAMAPIASSKIQRRQYW